VERRELLRAAALSFLAAPLSAEGQPGPKVARIGVLTLSAASWTPDGEAFQQGLQELAT
jgi:hypothetical protein